MRKNNPMSLRYYGIFKWKKWTLLDDSCSILFIWTLKKLFAISLLWVKNNYEFYESGKGIDERKMISIWELKIIKENKNFIFYAIRILFSWLSPFENEIYFSFYIFSRLRICQGELDERRRRKRSSIWIHEYLRFFDFESRFLDASTDLRGVCERGGLCEDRLRAGLRLLDDARSNQQQGRPRSCRICRYWDADLFGGHGSEPSPDHRGEGPAESPGDLGDCQAAGLPCCDGIRSIYLFGWIHALSEGGDREADSFGSGAWDRATWVYEVALPGGSEITFVYWWFFNESFVPFHSFNSEIGHRSYHWPGDPGEQGRHGLCVYVLLGWFDLLHNKCKDLKTWSLFNVFEGSVASDPGLWLLACRWQQGRSHDEHRRWYCGAVWKWSGVSSSVFLCTQSTTSSVQTMAIQIEAVLFERLQRLDHAL